MNGQENRIKVVMLVPQHGLLLFSTTLEHKPPLCKHLFLLPWKLVNDSFAVNPVVQWKIFDVHLFYIYMDIEKQGFVYKVLKKSGCWSLKHWWLSISSRTEINAGNNVVFAVCRSSTAFISKLVYTHSILLCISTGLLTSSQLRLGYSVVVFALLIIHYTLLQ